jgi:hypothetical protein
MIQKLDQIVAHEVEREALRQQTVLVGMVTDSCAAATQEEAVHTALGQEMDTAGSEADGVFGNVDEALDSETAWEVGNIPGADMA